MLANQVVTFRDERARSDLMRDLSLLEVSLAKLAQYHDEWLSRFKVRTGSVIDTLNDERAQAQAQVEVILKHCAEN